VKHHRDHHATIFVSPDIARQVEDIRRRWDGVMAAQIAAHVTLAYPREAPLAEVLAERLRAVSATVRPFRLRLGEGAYFGRPENGVYVAVDDVDGGYRALRTGILKPPFTRLDTVPHVTLAHPRTSTHGRACWEAARTLMMQVEFTVTDVALTAFDGTRWDVLETCSLQGPP
jgi:2'-5' RNA ligase